MPRRDLLTRMISRAAERNAEFVSHGLDVPSKMRYAPAVMQLNQLMTNITRPLGWYLMLCEHNILLTEACTKCKRLKLIDMHQRLLKKSLPFR